MFQPGRYLVTANDGLLNTIYVSSEKELDLLSYLKCQLLIKDFKKIENDVLSSYRKELIIQYYSSVVSVKATALKFGISEDEVIDILSESIEV